MTIGDDSASYLGIIDDLRIYKINLNQDDVTQIYGTGFGDFTRIEIIGSGQTRITATQFGNEDFEASLPQDNYLSVYKVPQQIEFGPIKDHSVGDFLSPECQCYFRFAGILRFFQSIGCYNRWRLPLCAGSWKCHNFCQAGW